jgi:hypothetical protein
MKLTDFFEELETVMRYPPALAKVAGGVNEAIFLSRLIMWKGKQANKEGWIYKTRDELTEETGLTRWEQETARKNLKERGFIEEKLSGVPPVTHYKLNTEKIEEAWKTHRSTLAKTTAPPRQKPPDNIKETLETTPETFSAQGAVCLGRKENEPLTDWFSRTWREGAHKDRAEALGVLYTFLFGGKPSYSHLFKMAKQLNSGKALFDLMLDGAKVQLSDDPHTFLQGMVNARTKKKSESQVSSTPKHTGPLDFLD